MFKIISSAYSKEVGHWDIKNTETGEIVACISTFSGFRRNIKQLKVKGKVVCDVKNQEEALEKLKDFFSETKLTIALYHFTIRELESDLVIVKNDSSRLAIKKDIERINKEIEKLEPYNLV